MINLMKSLLNNKNNYDQSNEWKHELKNKHIYKRKHVQSTLLEFAQGRGPFLRWAEMDLDYESLQLQN